jgi:D-alanine-D-alanine ligase
MNSNMTNAVLLFGGNSEERLVSVASAQNMSKRFNFTKLWYNHPSGEVTEVTLEELAAHARPFELEFKPKGKPFAKSIALALQSLSGAAIFLGLHGSEGEDGTLQRLLESKQIAFTGSGSAASALCFNKMEAKKKVAAAGVAVAEQIAFQRQDDAAVAAVLNGFFAKHGAIAVKPVTSGSSFGLHMIEKAESIAAAAKAISQSPHESYMAEKMLRGRELTVGVVDGEKGLFALPASEVVLTKGHSFDYEGKYLGKGTTEITPADLNSTEMKAAQELAMIAHKALGCYGYTRTDMILTASGPVFLETNTLPGLSGASFVPQQLKAAAIEVPSFIERQLSLARSRN